MRRRRKPRTINEELRTEVFEGLEPPSTSERQGESRLQRFSIGLIGALAVVAAKLGVAHLPTFVGLAVGAVIVGNYFSVFARSTRRKAMRGTRVLRTVLLAWLAVCVAATILVALGRFQVEDRAILGIVWPILALVWVAYRIRVAAANPGSETGSRCPR
jgi:hypothetical protein